MKRIAIFSIKNRKKNVCNWERFFDVTHLIYSWWDEHYHVLKIEKNSRNENNIDFDSDDIAANDS